MKRRIGILTSGGDCPGLNACIRGVARASYSMFDAEIIGIQDGYAGLIAGDYKEMKQSDFSGILTLGGTILGTRRTPFRNMRVVSEDGVDKVKAMKANYKKMKLDCLVTLGGNGTHKTANLLAEEGLNVIVCPRRSITISGERTSPSVSTRRWISRRRSSTAFTRRPRVMAAAWSSRSWAIRRAG